MSTDRHPKIIVALGLALSLGLAGAAGARPDPEMTRRRLQQLVAEAQGRPEREAELKAAASLLKSQPIRPDALPAAEAGELLRADALYLGFRLGEARQAYSRFVARWAQSPWAGYARYQLAQLLDRPEQEPMRESLLRSIGRDASPPGLGACALIAAIEARRGEPAEKRLAALDAVASGLTDPFALARLAVARGRLLHALGRFAEAWAAFGQAGPLPAEALPEAADAGFRTGQDLERVGELYDRILKESLMRGAFDARAVLRRGLLEERQGHSAAAADRYVRILMLQPRPPEAELALLRLGVLLRDRKAALPALAKAAKLPEDPIEMLRQAASFSGETGLQARLEYARALAGAGRVPEALMLYKALQSLPDAGDGVREEYRGLVQKAMPDPAALPAELLAHWAAHEQAFGARETVLVAGVLREAGLVHGAVELYRKALAPDAAKSPLSAEERRNAKEGLALALARGGDFTSVAPQVQAIGSIAPEQAFELFEAALDAGRCDLALKLAATPRLPPVGTERTRQLVLCLAEAGRVQAALALARAAAARDLGDLLLARGRPAEALEAYRKTAAEAEPELDLRQALCLLRLGRPAEAREALARAAAGSQQPEAREQAEQLLAELELEARYTSLTSGP
jgi:tetratricopeptide (TPR) repeat protein